MDQLSDLERLEALEEIKLLKARRDRAVDTHDWVLYEQLHAPDHRSLDQQYGQWTSAAQMIANVRQAMRGLLTMHHSHTPIISFEGRDKATGIWAMKGVSHFLQDGEPHWFMGLGHYHEEYQRRDGVWKFTGRALKYSHTRQSPGSSFPPQIESVSADEARPAATQIAIPLLPEGMSPLDRLVAVQAIEHLKARRDYAVDTKDWDTYLALHAPDHQSINDGFDPWLTAQQMIVAVRTLLDETRTSVHHSHTGEISFVRPDKAIGIWPMEDEIFWDEGDEKHWLHGFGFYHETYEQRGGEWLFTSRKLKRTDVRTTTQSLEAAKIVGA